MPSEHLTRQRRRLERFLVCGSFFDLNVYMFLNQPPGPENLAIKFLKMKNYNFHFFLKIVIFSEIFFFIENFDFPENFDFSEIRKNIFFWKFSGFI